MTRSCAVLLGVVVLLSGCGGSSSTRYSKAAFVSCLNSHGVGTQDINDPVTAADRRVAALLKPIAPNMIVAKFNAAEYVGVAFTRDTSRATQVATAFKKLMKLPGATPGKITQAGTLVLLTSPTITAGTQGTLTACEKSAAFK